MIPIKTNGYIKVPRGLLDKIIDKAAADNIHCDIIDRRHHGEPIRVQFKGELREQQEFAAAKLERYENGVLSAPTSFGKTVLAAYLISRHKVNMMILLNYISLLMNCEKMELLSE